MLVRAIDNEQATAEQQLILKSACNLLYRPTDFIFNLSPFNVVSTDRSMASDLSFSTDLRPFLSYFRMCPSQ